MSASETGFSPIIEWLRLEKVVTLGGKKKVTMKHKTRTERVYNETTGWYETREVELKGYTFTDDDRILIVRVTGGQAWSEPQSLDGLNTIAHLELSPVLYWAHSF